MKSLSVKLKEIQKVLEEQNIQTVSFDIDGTLYAMTKVYKRWWQIFFFSPLKSLRFLSIRKEWEKKREGNQKIVVRDSDVLFFEAFLLRLLTPDIIPQEIHEFIKLLQDKQITLYFLSDHGNETKLKALGLSHIGKSINCLSETGELKPHQKISTLFLDQYDINPETHLHLGDRWTDEEQARLLKSHFHYLAP